MSFSSLVLLDFFPDFGVSCANANKDTPVLSATKNVCKDCSFLSCKIHADIHSGSCVTKRQLTVGWSNATNLMPSVVLSNF